MATRVNTKFVLILSATVFAVVGIGGGLWFLQRRGDTTRHIKAGDQSMAEGEYEQAMKEYGRAVRKEPSNLDHLRKFEQALIRIRPQTQDRASELYRARVGVFSREATYRPQDPEAHLKLLAQLHETARFVNQPEWWQLVAKAAEEMWQRVPPTDPKRIYARLYRGLANMRVSMGRSDEEIDQAEQDLLAFVEAVPDDDLGWASLVAGQLAIADQLRIDGNTRRAQEKSRKVDQTLRRAVEAVPEGPEVARMAALHLALHAMNDEDAVSENELADAVNRMVELVTPSVGPALLMEAVAILRTVDQVQGASRAVEMLEQYLEAHPKEHFHRSALASIQYRNGDLDAAYEAADAVIEAEPAPVSLLSKMQHGLRVGAASLIVDIEFRRWEQADDAEKDAQLQRTEAARDRLASLVAEPEKEPFVLRADGKIALAKGDYSTAAARFEAALKQGLTGDFDTLWYAARSLDQLRQIGLALERLEAALALRPRNVAVLTEMARLQYRMGHYDEAAETIDRALRNNPDYDFARQLAQAIQSRRTGEEVEPINPVDKALVDASAAVDDGDLETARSTLLGALEAAPQDIRVLAQLTSIEVRAGRTTEAREYLDRALTVQPANRLLRRIQVSLDNDDPIEALKQYMEAVYEDEDERVVWTLINLRVLERQMDAAAQRHASSGDDQSADTARSQATRAREEAQGYLARARQLAPDHPLLLEHLLNEALMTEDWDTAQQLVERAQAVNADQAEGLIFKGRYELARRDYEGAVGTLTDATIRKHYSSLAWRLLGMAHEGLGNFDEARRTYEESYNCNPNDPAAVRLYVRLLVQMGDKTRALLVLRTARHVTPNDAVLQDSWLQLEADMGDSALAIRKRREIYEQSPGNRINAGRLALLLGLSKPAYEHLIDDHDKLTRDKWNLLPAEERQQMLDQLQAEWIRESEQILDRLEAEGGGGLELATLRARILKARGEFDAGEQVLRSFIERQDESELTAEMLVVLGDYQAGINRLDEAIVTLEAARTRQSPDRREADRALANLYFTQGRFAQAVELYLQLLDATGADRDIKTRVVQCYIALRQFGNARQLLEELVDAEGADFSAMMLSAAIERAYGDELFLQGNVEQAERKYAEQRDALARAEQLMPSSPLPHIRRAESLLNESRRSGKQALLDDALLALDRADAALAGTDLTSILRAEALRAKQDLRGAIGELTRLLDRSPVNVAAWRQLIQLYVQAGDVDTALQAIAVAIERNPTLARWHETKGDLQVLQRDIKSAAAAFGEAYRLEPSRTRLAKLADTMLATEGANFSEVIDLLVASKESLEDEPVLRSLYARALDGNGQRAEALQQMRIAYRGHRDRIAQQQAGQADLASWFAVLQLLFANDEPSAAEQFVRELSSDNPDAYELQSLARMWVSTTGQEGVSRAVELQREALKRCPADDERFRTRLLFDFGQYVLAAGDSRAAAEAFEQVISLDGGHALALNNAAYLYVEQLDDPTRALPYAERAAAIEPGDSNILDTLGWVYFKVGRYDQAQEHLRRSIELQPSAGTHLHLAHVLAQTDRLREAEIHLGRAAELRPDAETQAQIDRLADDITRRMREE